MKKLVISLQRRTDRKKEFYKNNLINYEFIEAIDYKRLNNFIVDENFRDPFKNRPVLKSEVACFLSHKKAWEKCLELNEPVIIFDRDEDSYDIDSNEFYELLLRVYKKDRRLKKEA